MGAYPVGGGRNKEMAKLSQSPQEVIRDVAWYYESPKSIDLYIRTQKLAKADSTGKRRNRMDESGLVVLHIPAKVLRETLKRMEAE
jgi:hypothetical protein